MRKSLEQLIGVAYSVKIYFQTESFEIHMFEDGSLVDFYVKKIYELSEVLKRTHGLEVRFLWDARGIIVRIFEDYSE